MDRPTRCIAEYAAGLDYGSLAPSARHAASRHFVDALACALGTMGSRPARIARAIAATANGSYGASVLGLSKKTVPEYAAFANAAMVRFLDFNDAGHGGHPSDMIPAILALAEPRRSSGREVIRAMHAAYETYAVLRRGGLYGDLLRRRHVDQLQAVVGCAVGAGVILGLDAPRIAHAISLALTPSVPLRVTRTGTLSDWKGCATAHSAMTGVFAARLAERGLTGPAQPFEGIAGLCEMLATGPLDLATIGQPRDGRSAIEATCLKVYPVEYSAQGPVQAVLSLRQQFDVADVEAMVVSLHWSGWHEIGGGAGDGAAKWNPTTRPTADHSLAYALAVSLLDGDLTVDSFSEARRNDPRLRSLIHRVRVEEDPKLTRTHAGELPRWPSRVEITLRGGRCLICETPVPKGHPLRPLSDAEIETKFLRLAGRVLSARRAKRLLAILWSLEDLDDIGTLMAELRRLQPGDVLG